MGVKRMAKFYSSGIPKANYYLDTNCKGKIKMDEEIKLPTKQAA